MREVNAMIRKVAHMIAVLSAIAAMGLAPTSALAESVKDSGSYDATYTKRDIQPIPDQDGHVLMLIEATGTATSSGPLNGFSVTERETADLRQGNGPQQGYVIFAKGSDQLIVKFQGNITTTLKDGQPNTTMKGSYAIVSATGALAGMQGEGNYSGYFTAEDKYHIAWEGTRTLQKGAMLFPND
jgi:hypothetical protein